MDFKPIVSLLSGSFPILVFFIGAGDEEDAYLKKISEGLSKKQTKGKGFKSGRGRGRGRGGFKVFIVIPPLA